MTIARLLRHAAMDLLSAAAFLAIWLLRERFDYDTQRGLMFWPVVLELYVAVALFVGAMPGAFGRGAIRLACFVGAVAACLAGAWLSGANSGMPQVWLTAFWLLLARVKPPPGLPWCSQTHLDWVHVGAGYSGLLWGAGFVATVVLMLVVPGEALPASNDELRTQAPTWIFPLVWTPYFIAEGLVRANHRTPPSAVGKSETPNHS